MSKKFEVGDEVETTQRVGDFYEAGARGTVKEIDGDDIWVRFRAGKYKLPFGDHGGWHTFAQWLRHVPPAQPAAPAVTSRAVVLTVEGVEYTAMFTLVNDRTGCALYWRKDNHEYALAGGTKRNPRDTYSADTGMRVAMRRACGIGRPYAHQLPAVYSAFRKWQHDQAALQSKQVKPLVVGAEVRAVKDDYNGGKYFRKGAIGNIVKVDTTGLHVHWTAGEFRRDPDTVPSFLHNRWWARADEIEAV